MIVAVVMAETLVGTVVTIVAAVATIVGTTVDGMIGADMIVGTTAAIETGMIVAEEEAMVGAAAVAAAAMKARSNASEGGHVETTLAKVATATSPHGSST